MLRQSLPAWGVWIEIKCEHAGKDREFWSLPAWGVWIEIQQIVCFGGSYIIVAPRMGSVD